MKFSSSQKLFYDIGSGVFDPGKLLRVVKQYQSLGSIDEDKDKEFAQIDEEEFQELFYEDARTSRNREGLIINGDLTDVKYSYARCCNPIPGDEVIGFISRNGDIKIHRVNCKNTRHLINTDSERIVDVAWAKNTDSRFIGAIKIIGEDRVGLINDITNVISKSLKTNMKSINVSSDSGMFEGTLILYVDHIDHLENAIKRIQKIDGIKQVYRYE